MLAEGFTQYFTIQSECNGCEHTLRNFVSRRSNLAVQDWALNKFMNLSKYF